ncbi:hypothetical protein [Puia dinghuensis]|uniref:Uncharacterized protein n=1 Tax=Puia dinghuensis TaxID=1792502 RepID=A0A8J2U9T7_9BACT|nr:hypothetical protein [Puia dinghuensis]GGA88538.1 hypothetical protein GCM10011511_09710 [Puia dinghuensis]
MTNLNSYADSLIKVLRKKGLFVILVSVLFVFSAFRGTGGPFFRNLLLLLLISYVIQILLLIQNSYLFYGIRCFLIICLCFEFIAGRLNMAKAKHSIEIGNSTAAFDSLLGFKTKPDMDNEISAKVVDRDTLYKVTYSTDNWGRRIDNAHDTGKPGNKHIVLLGCSFTFGEGLPYHETISYDLDSALQGYNTYNYGIIGGGPHQFALFFQPGTAIINKTSIKQDSGFALYTYIDDHLNRVYGGSRYLTYGSSSPDVYIQNNKIIVKKRSGIVFAINSYSDKSELLKYFNVQRSYPRSESFYRRFAAIINYTASKYRELFPRNQFVVGLYPVFSNDTAWVRYVDRNIKIINVPVPGDYCQNPAKYHISMRYDIHPSKYFNQYYVNYIISHFLTKQ